MSEQKGSTATNAIAVPAKWQARETSDGSTELRVVPRGRGYWVVATLLLSAAAMGRAIIVRGIPQDNAGLWVAAALLLALFALWCAFAGEYWRMGNGYLEHHIDFGPLRRARRYQNAVLGSSWEEPLKTLRIIDCLLSSTERSTLF